MQCVLLDGRTTEEHPHRMLQPGYIISLIDIVKPNISLKILFHRTLHFLKKVTTGSMTFNDFQKVMTSKTSRKFMWTLAWCKWNWRYSNYWSDQPTFSPFNSAVCLLCFLTKLNILKGKYTVKSINTFKTMIWTTGKNFASFVDRNKHSYYVMIDSHCHCCSELFFGTLPMCNQTTRGNSV